VNLSKLKRTIISRGAPSSAKGKKVKELLPKKRLLSGSAAKHRDSGGNKARAERERRKNESYFNSRKEDTKILVPEKPLRL